MTQLAAQSIHRLCTNPGHYAPTRKLERLPLISPYLPERTIINGSSAGLSGASYDIRIGHDLTLGPNPAAILDRLCQATRRGVDAMEFAFEEIRAAHTYKALAWSLETFAIPLDVVAYVVDKSTCARRLMTTFNTLFDPGFVGTATLELVNLGPEVIKFREGDPVCQIVFHWLDEPTGKPYDGKYQDQPPRAVPALFEANLDDKDTIF